MNKNKNMAHTVHTRALDTEREGQVMHGNLDQGICTHFPFEVVLELNPEDYLLLVWYPRQSKFLEKGCAWYFKLAYVFHLKCVKVILHQMLSSIWFLLWIFTQADKFKSFRSYISGKWKFPQTERLKFPQFEVFYHLKWVLKGSNVYLMYIVTNMTRIYLLFQL